MNQPLSTTIGEAIGWLLHPFLALMMPSRRLYFVYLLTALLMAVVIYVVRVFQSTRLLPPSPQPQTDSQAQPSPTRASLWSFLFPKSVWGHPSAIQDYKYFYCYTLLESLLILPLMAIITPTVALMMESWLNTLPLSLTLPGPWLENRVLIMAFCTVTSFLVADFFIFLAHYLQHKIPWLWEFHKVHHSAKVLTPITLYRLHPFDELLTFSFVGVGLGVLYGCFQVVFHAEGLVLNMYGVNLFYLLFYFTGYNLRHSHVWLDYGPVWDRIFISPAQHQIHHSAEPRHFDKNMGLMLSIWDGLFGTLYVPKSQETFQLGIASADQPRFEGGALKLFWLPFIRIAEQWRWSALWQQRKLWGASLGAMVLLLIVTTHLYAAYQQPKVNDSLYLENLTWTEVRDRLKAGNNRVIVPTGGTEQNGPHVILGKHNRVVAYTAGRIAQTVGHTLVAPVITYVPEDPHMKFSGTLSISETLFEQLLEATAASLKHHGFKTIYFLGDSGGNQAAQAKVAQKLTRAWQKDGVKVIHLSDYYASNGQQLWLMNQGLGVDEIGNHAGIRDTSEVLFVDPQGVRQHALKDHQHDDYEVVGSNGNPKKAKPLIGWQLTELKINAAVRQIKANP